MNTQEILRQIETFGDAKIKKILMTHGAREPLSGVRVADLKRIQKQVKVDHQLALELFETGHYDAMYLAGLIADDMRMTRKDLERWSRKAYAGISEYTLPWVAAQGRFGWEMGLAWIGSKKETVAATGWMTLSCVVALTPDDSLDMKALKSLLVRVSKEIHKAPNRVRAAMNTFMIAVGCYVLPLSGQAVDTARAIGDVSVDVGGTACKIPYAPDYIGRAKKRGSLGKKRKTVKC
jgi:hypothetical protein